MFPDRRGQVLLALLSMRDEKALDLVLQYAGEPARSKHPFGSDDAFEGKPLAWLLLKDPKPAHRYTEAEVLGLLDRVGKAEAFLLAPYDVAADLVADAMLMALIRCQPMSFPFNGRSTSWARTTCWPSCSCNVETRTISQTARCVSGSTPRLQ
jgi:hypothetical protein